ncbi:MAG: SDR family oxidoreductase [Dokdonia sp.]|jgi:short-subunit dehydrogenase
MAKVVFITGASSGIGAAVAQYLAGCGYKVYGTSRTPKAELINGVHMLALDVTKRETIQAAVAQIIQRESRIDVLVNNAGMGITGPIEETPDSAVQHVFDTNYFGPLEVIKAVLPQMRQQQNGLVINITSIAGYMGLPYRGIYSATKGALGITTEAYRMELKEFNVKMTTVAPGDFATNIAAGRFHAPLLENSPYKHNYGNTLALMDEHVDQGMDTKVMAKVIHKIITTKNPKVHYRVGFFMQKFSIVLKRILPDTWYEKLLLNHYNL